LVQRWSALAP